MIRRNRMKRKLAVLLAGGVLFAGSGLSCFSFMVDNALSSTNFCFLFNCNDGALGGLIDFCGNVSFRSFVGGAQDRTNDGTFLADCPQQ